MPPGFFSGSIIVPATGRRDHDNPAWKLHSRDVNPGYLARCLATAGQRDVARDLHSADDTHPDAVMSVLGTRADAAAASLSPQPRSVGVTLAGIGG
jgi:hypothetical protein